ncbi:MAG: radical SAM protein [Dehalococcoidia bacterium]|nr:radical SAM protein [Dehalococcoidia bacterium]
MSGPVHYEEAQCKTALNRVAGMGFQWFLNPYRGCVHSCHYCFARRFHGYLDRGAGQDCSSVITVKVNLPEVLIWELAASTWRREMVALGTATDSYQPIEGKYRLTRRALEALHRYRTPVGVVTKGTMVVRDVDVLADMATREGCTVCFSVTTLDRDLWERLEPGTSPPWQRFRALERMRAAGVNAGVLLAPVVPGITDFFGQPERRGEGCLLPRRSLSGHPDPVSEIGHPRALPGLCPAGVPRGHAPVRASLPPRLRASLVPGSSGAAGGWAEGALRPQRRRAPARL